MKRSWQALVQIGDFMKQTLLVLACLSTVSLAAMAADDKTFTALGWAANGFYIRHGKIHFGVRNNSLQK